MFYIDTLTRPIKLQAIGTNKHEFVELTFTIRPVIEIYRCDGVLISSVKWLRRGARESVRLTRAEKRPLGNRKTIYGGRNTAKKIKSVHFSRL